MQQPPQVKRGGSVKSWARQQTQYSKENTVRAGTGIKVKRTANGTTVSSRPYFPKWYNFQLISDDTYTPSSTERRIAIRGGYWSRASSGLSELQITDPGSATNFTAAGGAEVTDIAACKSVINDGDTWVVWLSLYNNTHGKNNPINPEYLIADFDATGTRPTDPDSDNILNYCRVLGTVTNNGGYLSFRQEWLGGNIKDFMMIPDGKPMTASGQSVYSMDFVTGSSSEEQDGLLQDYQAYESLVTSNSVTNNSGDTACPYFYYSTSGATIKYYARFDGSNPSDWNETASIDITSNAVRLYDFLAPTIVTGAFDATTASGTTDLTYSVLMRYRNDVGYHELKYVDISDMNVASADYADELAPGGIDHWELGDMPSATNSDHDGRYWYHMGVGRFDSTNDNFETLGHCYSNSLGIINTTVVPTDQGGDPNNQWSLSYFQYKPTNGANLKADTNHEFLAGKVLVSNTEIVSNTATVFGNSGAIQTAGGIYASENIRAVGTTAPATNNVGVGQFIMNGFSYTADLVTKQEAGLFTDGSNIQAKLSTSSEAGNFFNGSIGALIGTTTDSIAAVGGNISLTSGVFEHDSNAGVTITRDGDTVVSGGVVVSEEFLNDYIDARVEDILAGYNLP